MPVTDLMSTKRSELGYGHVVSGLYGGQYRVVYNGRDTVATSQAGSLAAGTKVTLVETPAGLVVVSAGSRSASTSVEVTIDG